MPETVPGAIVAHDRHRDRRRPRASHTRRRFAVDALSLSSPPSVVVGLLLGGGLSTAESSRALFIEMDCLFAGRSGEAEVRAPGDVVFFGRKGRWEREKKVGARKSRRLTKHFSSNTFYFSLTVGEGEFLIARSRGDVDVENFEAHAPINTHPPWPARPHFSHSQLELLPPLSSLLSTKVRFLLSPQNFFLSSRRSRKTNPTERPGHVK